MYVITRILFFLHYLTFFCYNVVMICIIIESNNAIQTRQTRGDRQPTVMYVRVCVCERGRSWDLRKEGREVRGDRGGLWRKMGEGKICSRKWNWKMIARERGEWGRQRGGKGSKIDWKKEEITQGAYIFICFLTFSINSLFIINLLCLLTFHTHPFISPLLPYRHFFIHPSIYPFSPHSL